MDNDTWFDSIIGHEAIKARLIHWQARDRMPHAMIFAGPAGIGKTMMARAIASAMVGRPLFLHEEAKAGQPLESDRDDAYYLAPAGAMLKVDQFRKLQSRLMLQGQAGSSRVCIIDHVETMNTEFANRMLKILEEPPSGVCFILITDQPALLLPTLVSRCTEIFFSPVGDAEMLAGLLRLRGGRAQDYEDAVAWGNGIVRAVFDYLQGTGSDEVRYALDFLRIMGEHACPYAAWLAVSVNLTEGETAEILRWSAMFLRDMAVLRSGAGQSGLRLKRYTDDMMKLLTCWTDTGIFKIFSVLDEGMEALVRHVNVHLVWDYVSIQCIKAKGGI